MSRGIDTARHAAGSIGNRRVPERRSKGLIVTDEQNNEFEEVVEVETEESVEPTPPQYGVGPFSIREVALVGVWLVAFVVSFFPVTATVVAGFVEVRFEWASVWLSGLSWVLTIGLPTVAVFLVVLRRLSPDGIRRIGSLSVDQFASVAFSVSAVVWLGWVWETIVIAVASGEWVRSWVIWVQLVFMLAGVVLTVLAPFIPPFSEDFRHRPEIVAHRAARPLRPVAPRPVREQAHVAAAAPGEGYAPDAGYPTGEYAAGAYTGAAYSGAAYTGGAYADGYATGAVDPYAAQSAPYGAVETPAAEASDTGAYGLAGEQNEWTPAHARGTFEAAEPAPVRQQAFWALVPEERDIVDESGAAVFRIGPTAWALVIEDRGSSFVVRHEDGRIGNLYDVSGVTRG